MERARGKAIVQEAVLDVHFRAGGRQTISWAPYLRLRGRILYFFATLFKYGSRFGLASARNTGKKITISDDSPATIAMITESFMPEV